MSFQATGITGYFELLPVIASALCISKKDIHAAIVDARIAQRRTNCSDLPNWDIVHFQVSPDKDLSVTFRHSEPTLSDISFNFAIQNGAITQA